MWKNSKKMEERQGKWEFSYPLFAKSDSCVGKFEIDGENEDKKDDFFRKIAFIAGRIGLTGPHVEYREDGRKSRR